MPWSLCFPDFVPSSKHPIMFHRFLYPLKTSHKKFYTVPSTPWVCFHRNLASLLLIRHKFVLNVSTAALGDASQGHQLVTWEVPSLRLSLLSTDRCSLHVCVFNFPIFCGVLNCCSPDRYLYKSDSLIFHISLHTNANRASKWSKHLTSVISITWQTEPGLQYHWWDGVFKSAAKVIFHPAPQRI